MQKNFSNTLIKKAKIISSCAMFYDLKNPKKFVKDIFKISMKMVCGVFKLATC